MPIDGNLVDQIWTDKPAPQNKPVFFIISDLYLLFFNFLLITQNTKWIYVIFNIILILKVILHDVKYAGKSIEHKLDSIQNQIFEKYDIDVLIVPTLDDIACNNSFQI